MRYLSILKSMHPWDGTLHPTLSSTFLENGTYKNVGKWKNYLSRKGFQCLGLFNFVFSSWGKTKKDKRLFCFCMYWLFYVWYLRIFYICNSVSHNMGSCICIQMVLMIWSIMTLFCQLKWEERYILCEWKQVNPKAGKGTQSVHVSDFYNFNNVDLGRHPYGLHSAEQKRFDSLWCYCGIRCPLRSKQNTNLKLGCVYRCYDKKEIKGLI